MDTFSPQLATTQPAPRAMSRRRLVASLCAMPALGGIALAQSNWPTRPVRLLLGQPAGSGSDPMARGLAPHLSAAFGQPFVIENMPGAGGTAAAAAVARADDEHTLGIVLGGPTTTAKAMNPNLSYDPATAFRSISLLNRSSFVLTVHAGSFSPGARFADVIDQARAQPGRLSYASIGPGTVTHLAMEELKATLNLDIVHVPYRGFPQASLDLAAGRCQLMFNVAAAAAEHIAAGRLVGIAQTGATRTSFLPDIPTLQELKVPSAPFFGWSGMIAPASFPEAMARRLATVIRSALATDPAARGGLDRSGSEVLGTDPEELQRLQETEARRWNAVIARLGLRATE
ncbi:Tripartite-type tricarboxylate transporter, receptor component TctC [Bosea lupini]|uniref:Tripartite-type tricarboxylate transporter, receptor component TctC n=1 Tax=Bosea lupini TaxID=1036779 RepID=A0A1H7PKX2_9HYPH|nr:tripartite tricarboxylate transporter substrate-binding protein [Bosea lupini]SEL36461.1 Tripartite-type tricarboxylate transporter, receptor component TctC [Bosea lupini]